MSSVLPVLRIEEDAGLDVVFLERKAMGEPDTTA